MNILYDISAQEIHLRRDGGYEKRVKNLIEFLVLKVSFEKKKNLKEGGGYYQSI